MNSRRQCINYGQCALFRIFQKTNRSIIQKYDKASQFICYWGLRTLRNTASQYLKSKPQISELTIQNNQMIPEESYSFMKKKQLVNQSESISISQSNICTSFNIKIQPKFGQGSQKTKKEKKKRLSQAQQLRQSLKKMNIQEQDFCNSQSQEQNMERMDAELPNQPHGEWVQDNKIEGNRCLVKTAQKQSESSDESYPLTEYSSNQSSNQHQYVEQLKFQTSLPAKISSQYLSSGICHSPIKSKSNKKRIFIRNKKIPRWAQDLQQVRQERYKQIQNYQQFDPKKIYGVFVVQKLDSNIIFKSDKPYRRGSSAKWNKFPYNQFVQ